MTSPFPANPDENVTPRAAAEPHFSLLRLSAGQRLGGASVIIAALWLAVWWAL
jgi:hypothetical protein